MSPLIFLVILVLKAIWTVGVEGMQTPRLYAAIGSSVFFPGENLDKYTFYDFRKVESTLIVTCHDGCSVRDPYEKRGRFFQNNGTFLLNELRVEDSGIFEYKMNFTVKGQIHLQVMAPVVEPVLLKPEMREKHLFVFTCLAQGDGPFNFTLLRNDNETLGNAVTMNNSRSWSMNGLDPATYGRFSCNVTNPVSYKTSPSIELPPPAPVMETVLLKQEVIENGSQCLVTFTCQAKGDGPFNFTLLRNDNEILRNVISLDNSSSWSMDGWHPKTSSIFSCIVANAISSQTSAIELLPPVTLKEVIIRLFAITFLCHCISALFILCMKYKMRKEEQEEKNNNNEENTLQSDDPQHHGPGHQDPVNSSDVSHSICPLSGWRCPTHARSTVNKDRILSLVNRTFAIADNILGFLKEFAVLVICLDGEIFPVECCVLLGFFLLCRVIYWIFFFVNRHRETNVRFSSAVERFCNPAMIVSNMIVIPAFCIAILVLLIIRYRPPCGTMNIWTMVLLAVYVLIFIFYLWIKHKVKAKGKAYIQGKEDHPESQQLVNAPNGDVGRPEDNGDLGRPEDNRNPNCEGPVPPGIIGNPNVDQGAPMQSEVFNEGDPEDQMIPKPKDGQPKVAEVVPCNSHVGAGHCLLTIEKEVVVDKGPVSNG